MITPYLGGCCKGTACDKPTEEFYTVHWKTCSSENCNTMDPRLIFKKQAQKLPIRTYVTFNDQTGYTSSYKQGQKRPLDTPKRMIERRQREGEREKER